MPRRRRTSLLADLTSALALLPWWVCLLIGVVAYAVLHGIATQSLPTAVRSHQLGGALIGAFARSAATVAQYAVPILCIAAAVMSFFGRRKRRELLLHATEGGFSAAAIDAMSWQDFELLIAEAFRLQGFTVAEKGGASADGGVDMELTKDGERWLVQVKHWRAKLVPVEVVRELAGVMPFRRAVGAYVITSGRFTGPAEEFASGRGIKLVNGSKLAGMLEQARASLDAGRAGTVAPVRAAAPAVPACPKCSRPMVLRKAQRGPNAGGAFWGCSGYSQGCRGTRPA